MTKYIDKETGESLTKEEYDAKFKELKGHIQSAENSVSLAEYALEEAEKNYYKKVRKLYTAENVAQVFELSYCIQE